MLQTVAIYAGVLVVVFGAGVALSQKVKDAIAGVPASLRAELTTLETSIKAQVSSAQKAVVADVKSKVVIQTPVLQTSSAPLAPATVAVTGATGTAQV